MLDLASSCQATASELIELFKRIGPTSSSSKRASLAAAFRLVWNKQIINELQNSVDCYRKELSLHILVDIRNRIERTQIEQDRRFDKFQDDTKSTIQSILSNQDAVSQGFQHTNRTIIHLHQSQEAQANQRHNEALDAIERLRLHLSQPDMGSDWTTWQNFIISQINTKPSISVARDKSRPQLVLDCLKYRVMTDRQDEVTEAHRKTFEWIFREPKSHIQASGKWSNFAKFIIMGGGCYWINGKAGSGKSTLMKFLCSHQKLKEMLTQWASEQQLITASFFFWNLGTAEQKLQKGLWRSILYQILSQMPDMIEELFPEMWEEAGEVIAARELERTNRPAFLSNFERSPPSVKPPTETEMRRALNALTRTRRNVKMCFVIDGIDEYEGDHTEISSFLRSLSSEKLKMVLSSRPIAACEDAFADCPGLRLQDLTYSDIQLYVNDKLSSHDQFKELSKSHPDDVTNILKELGDKASGVFLWIKLAVASLLSGLRNHDRISDLRSRLRQLPPDLEDLYKHMLSKVTPLYMRQASQIFQLVERSSAVQPDTPLWPIFLSLAEEEDAQLAFTASTRPIGFDDLTSRVISMKKRLVTRCCGLLEVHHTQQSPFPRDSEIQYLHRTVAEFLRRPNIWADLISWTTGVQFYPDESLARASLLMLKKNVIGDDFEFGPSSVAAIRFARAAEKETGRSQATLLDCLDRTLQDNWDHKGTTQSMHWSIAIPRARIARNFLPFAARNGLEIYVQERLCGKKFSDFEMTRPILHEVLDPQLTFDGLSQVPLPSHRYLDFLFRHGADPNTKWSSSSAWQLVLHRTSISPADSLPWLGGVIMLFLHYGAFPNETLGALGAPGPRRNYTALRIVQDKFIETDGKSTWGSQTKHLSPLGEMIVAMLVDRDGKLDVGAPSASPLTVPSMRISPLTESGHDKSNVILNAVHTTLPNEPREFELIEHGRHQQKLPGWKKQIGKRCSGFGIIKY